MNISEMKTEDIQARRAEILERRNAIDVELETAEGDSLDALEKEVDALNDEERALQNRDDEIQKAYEERQAQLEDVLKHGKETEIIKEKTMDNTEIRNSKEYIDAFANYIKTGDDSECRALLTYSTDDETGVPVPELVEGRVRTAWQREGITSRVRKTYLKGNVKIGYEASATGAVIHDEGDEAVTEEELVLYTVNLIPKSIKKWISISDEVYDLTGSEFLDYIYDELTYQIAKKAADALLAEITSASTVSLPDYRHVCGDGRPGR